MRRIRSVKKALAVLLSASMIFGMTPIRAGAEETTSGNELRAKNDHYQNGFCVNGKVENGVYVHNEDCSYDGCCGYEPAVLKEKVTFYDTYKSKDVTLPSAYEIANAGQLYWFAGVVNGDKNVCKGGVEQNTGVNAILTADITINQNVLTADGQLNETDKSSFLKWTPIGGGDNVFYGAINGNHHVIRGLYADENRDYVGLIGNASTYIYYGTYSSKYWVTVEQLGIEDSYIKGNNYVGALAGVSYGSVYSCYNTGTVVATGKYAGGIQGKIVSNSTYYDYTYCYNRGSITGTDYVGGITGHFSGKMAHMHNCYNTGRVIGQGSNVHMIAGWVDTMSTSNISDCYYDNSRGADDTYATGLNAGAFASGEAAYLLNIYNKKKQTVRFRQTIGTDLYPVLTTGSKEVYAQAVVNCDGTSSEESRYTNEQIDESVQYTAHKIDAFGICTVCGKYAEPQKSADGYYEITNAGNLYWFAGRVNGGSKTINARIMNDIVVNEGTFTQTEDGTLLYNGKEISDSNKPRIWTPIGGYSNRYGGVIDGQYHTISGLYNGQCIDYAGFLGDCWGEVKNLGVINSCFVTKYGSCDVGGIAGTIRGSAVLYNCYFQGILMPATLSTYGLIGRVQSTSDKSCILNCYYCIDSQNIQSYQGIEKVSVEELVSGEAAWRLNQNNITYKYNNDSKKYELMKDSKMVWGQILTGENQSSYPSAYQESLGNAVYRNVSKYQVCEHLKEPTDYADEKNANRVMEYSFGNGNTQTKPEFVDKGFVWNANDKNEHVCSVCGSVQGHVIVYSVKDNHTIKAGCLYDDNENRGSLTLTAPDYPEGENAVTYDGSAKEVKVENTIEGVEPKVTYTYQAAGSETTETLSEGVKPMNAGSYTASVSLTGADNNTATASVTFTIEQATPTITWTEGQKNQSVFYTGNTVDVSKIKAPTVTLVNNETFSATISYSYCELKAGIASGEFISGLPTEPGTYEIKASIPADGNYTAAEGIMTLEIEWLDLEQERIAATLTDQNDRTLNPDKEWWATKVKFTAPENYEICDSVNGTYGKDFTYSKATNEEAKEITYYLKNTDGEIGKKTATVRIADPNNCSHVDEKSIDSIGHETREPDGFCDKCGKRLQYKISLSSRAEEDGSGAIVAALTGGGLKDSGKEITITAPEKEGFQFIGWYIRNEDDMEQELAKELSYTFTPENDLNIVAVYRTNGNVKLSVTGESNAYSVQGTTQTSTSMNKDYKAGTKIVVEYVGDNNTEFLYWKNDSGKIVSKNSKYEFTLVSNTSLTAVTVANAGGSDNDGYNALVVFESSYGQIMQAETWNSKNTSQTLPAGPSKLGGTFKHWMIEGDSEERVATAESICKWITDKKPARITLIPVYEEDTTTYTVTVNYNTNDSSQTADTYADKKIGDTLTVTAKDISGKKFAYWSSDAEGTNILSYDKSYFIRISGNVTLYANYKDETEVVEAKPAIAVTNVYSKVVDGKKKLSFEVTRSVPEGYELQEQGVIYTISSNYKNNEAAMVIGADGVKIATSSDKLNNGVLTMNINVTGKEDTVVYLKGYVIVKDSKTGNLETIYTTMEGTSYNTTIQQ